LYPAIVVCPAIVKLNWQREILAWVLENEYKKIHIISGRKNYALPEARWFIINFDILPDWVEELRRHHAGIIIFDEIHYAKTSTSGRGRASRELAVGVPFVLGLSGTPILNRPVELVNPLRILGRIDELGGRPYFERRYCEAGKDNFGRWNTNGAAHLKELNDRLRSTGILIRRLKADVLRDLPKKLPPAIIPIELSNAAEYRRAERDLAKWLGERAVEDDDFKRTIRSLSPLDKVKAISAHRGRVEWRARQNEKLRRFSALKRLSTEGKLHGIKEHVNDFLASGEKLVLFGFFVDTQTDLVVEWPHAAHALGPDSKKVRWDQLDKFHDDPECKLIICSLTAIGIGVNQLVAAHHVGFVELGWTPADHDQAEDRLHRIGQKYPVTPYYYVGVDTIENDIIEIIENKRRVIAGAIEGQTWTQEDAMNHLSRKLLAKYRGE
jgi:SWI/SNF-related matrix-associated actin-dependent regulator 1 of chromatin subfamily A